MPKTKFRQARHAFWMQQPGGPHKYKAYANVIEATKPVTLVLTREHVQRSRELKGRGSSAHCSGAICALAHADKFPHPVAGLMDFNVSRCFVATKFKHGNPIECVVYEHDSKVPDIQDAPGGHDMLDRMIAANGGHLTIQLRPYRKRSDVGRKGSHSASGVRTEAAASKGYQHRHAKITAGGTGVAP